MKTVVFSVNAGKGEGEVHPRTGHKVKKKKQKYRSTISLTSALDGVGGQDHAPAALLLGNTCYPLYRRLGGSQVRAGQVRKNSPPTGFDPLAVQFVPSRYTDCAMPAHRSVQTSKLFNNFEPQIFHVKTFFEPFISLK